MTRWTRRPTGLLGAQPTGPRTRVSPNEKPSERRALELENACADRIASKGYRVHQNPTKQEVADARLRTGDIGKPEKAPDFLIEGYVFDCYAPTPPVPARAVWSAVSRKINAEQTQRVILNLQDWQGDLGALHKQFDDWPIPGLKELAAVARDGAIIQIVRRD